HEEGFSISIIGNDIQHSPFTILHELRRNKKKTNHLPKRKKIMLIEEKNADVITF
ncbi:helix-turn-helix domain-containing protein, partial [Enterococcus faecium]|nr:helix-turn-helix domain-containing protein [Enterococcus faecium]HAQ0789161.1 helix-turn-helix domain-containing protein [Enterococcus faecium]